MPTRWATSQVRCAPDVRRTYVNRKIRKVSLLTVGLCVPLLAGRTALGVDVLWTSPNTHVTVGTSGGEFENPLSGSEFVQGYRMVEWRDADYQPGQPNPYDDWANTSQPGNTPDGNTTEVWLRGPGYALSTTTNVPSEIIGVHLASDSNDGLADIEVDGVLVAQLDMGTTPYSAFVLVEQLAKAIHTVEVVARGIGQGGWHDVAIKGASVLQAKWYQPPEPVEPDNIFLGWNEESVCCWDQLVADDWYCGTDDAVSEIIWWGSFKGWKEPTPPHEQPIEQFHIMIWTDVPADPGGLIPFSHPGVLIHGIYALNYTTEFAGWDYDPRTGEYESAFRFSYTLDPTEYFHQQPGGNVYWIMIAACYGGNPPGDYAWGWKSRPRDVESLAPDDAVTVFNPNHICPQLGARWEDLGGGTPIWWPTEQDSWDMAFELIGRAALPDIKWEQRPDTHWPGLHAHDSGTGFDYQTITLADQFECQGGYINDLHWYGNYELDGLQQEIRGSGIRSFHLSLHASVPGVPWCLPGGTLWAVEVPFEAVREKDTGLVNNEGSPIYRYSYVLPKLFTQTQGEIYWFDIAAMSLDPTDPPHWRWQEAGRNAVPTLCPAAAQLGPIPTPWRSIEWPDSDPPLYTDLAFEVTSIFLGELTVKWSQPPVRYVPTDAYTGWNEWSVFGSHQIAADDWVCDDRAPVTDIHWWGSYLGWRENDPPPVTPDQFHIAVWTDVPAVADPPFSHPGDVIWDYWCSDFSAEFVGWDWDPRAPMTPPEACYRFECKLPDKEAWFEQGPSCNIYWTSIAASYMLADPRYPFGWKTRPRDPASQAPDDAVRVFDPTVPDIPGMPYITGEPIWWPTEADSWDLAFALTTGPINTGACCTGSGSGHPCFDDMTRTECERIGGYYHGNDTVCGPQAACCFDDYSCEDLHEICCNESGGRIPGDPACLGDQNRNGRDDACEPPPEADLGDAPDSSNSYPPALMTAYPPATPANFPTVYVMGSPPHGPIHRQPEAVAFLGDNVTLDEEADIGPDEDGVNNIDPPNDAPDQDGADDGIPVPLLLPHCVPTTFEYVVTVTNPAWRSLNINVWFDWTRDGDWDDVPLCTDNTPAPEWAVQNQVFTVTGAGRFKVTTPAFVPWHLLTSPTDAPPIWMRITLSEQAWDPVGPTEGHGGSGPSEGYEVGETEDYYFVPNVHQTVSKWSQPPVPAENVFYGWNEFSACCDTMVLDDWYCDTDDPVTDIHWWGSYQGWREPVPPPVPFDHYHIWIWTDVSTDDPGNEKGFSHPGVLLREIMAMNFTEEFVGWDYDPRTGEYEAAFRYTYRLDPSEYFYQESGPNIYWIGIGAGCSPEPREYPWGWKTRPRAADSPAPDDAVVMPNELHLCPLPGATWEELGGGYPLYWPTPDDSWDMAFELTTGQPVTIFKWEQMPNLNPPMDTGMDVDATYSPPPEVSYVLANDYECTVTGPLTEIDVWGSWYQDRLPLGDAGNVTFRLSIHADIPADQSPTEYSMPGELLWSREFFPEEFDVELYADGLQEWWYEPGPGGFTLWPGDTMCWLYRFFLDPAEFWQEGTAANPIIYWLNVQAFPQESFADFGWKTSMDQRIDDAVWAVGEDLPGAVLDWQELRYPGLHPRGGQSVDLAFVIIGQPGDRTKWSQPPVSFVPETAFTGWDELSIYGGPQIVSDDWYCDTADPVTDVHWWGSHIGWAEREPPHLPDAFHIGIWTDVPVGPDDTFSHPREVIHEYRCEDYRWEFVGWDIDPRDPPVPPEAAFKYSCDLPEEYWFNQEPGGNIYWVSIAALYTNEPPNMYSWGWKTRPRDSQSQAPDDAVVIWDPTTPSTMPPGRAYQSGGPIWYPTEDDSWDMAFELTTRECLPTDPPEPEFFQGVVNSKNRYLSIKAGTPGRNEALRVRFVSLPPPFDVWDYANSGQDFFVGEPHEACENSGKGLETAPEDCPPALPTDTFWAAPLVCPKGAAHYMDWHGWCNSGMCAGGLRAGEGCTVDDDCVAYVHLYHEGIVPSGVYDIQAIDDGCPLQEESNYSAPLRMIQARWGDVCGPGPGGACSGVSDGTVDVTNDVLGVLDKFANVNNLQKVRADIEPGDDGINNGPDFKVNVANDVLFVLCAFAPPCPYPFWPGDPCAPDIAIPQPQPRIEGYSHSECSPGGGHSAAGGYPGCGEDQILLTAEPRRLHVLHRNAAYNCCPDDIVISLSVEGMTLRLREQEVLTTACHCLCCYEVEATVDALAPGVYTVEFCWYDYDTDREECYIEDIQIP